MIIVLEIFRGLEWCWLPRFPAFEEVVVLEKFDLLVPTFFCIFFIQLSILFIAGLLTYIFFLKKNNKYNTLFFQLSVLYLLFKIIKFEYFFEFVSSVLVDYFVRHVVP